MARSARTARPGVDKLAATLHAIRERLNMGFEAQSVAA